MPHQSFEYEVAISFLAQDEIIALELHQVLNPRVKTFVYSKQQEEVLGTDGMETFSAVFSNKSRLNVVLFRTGWGQTRWTRVEETAIKDRVFNDGWETFCFIRLDKSPQPIWIPRTYLYIDFADKGIEGSRAIIEQKILELGGQVKPESLQDFAVRLKNDLANNEYIRKYPDTYEALSDCKVAIQHLIALFESMWEMIRQNSIGVSIGENKKSKDSITLSAEDICMKVRWLQPISNSIYSAKLQIHIFSYSNYYGEGDLKTFRQSSFTFSINSIRERGWFDDQAKFWKSDDLVNQWLRHFLNVIKDHQEH